MNRAGRMKACFLGWCKGLLAGLLCLGMVAIQDAEAGVSPGKHVEEVYPGLATGVLKSARLVSLPKETLLKVGEEDILSSFIQGMQDKLDPKMRDDLEKNLFFVLEQETTKVLLLREARVSGVGEKGISEQELLERYLHKVADKAEVSEEETREFYEANRAMLGGMSFDQVKDGIRGWLLQEKRQKRVDQHILELAQRADLRINQAWVKDQAARAMENPVDKARMSGRPTMVEFGAPGCPACEMMRPVLEQMRKAFKDRLNMVIVNVREHPILAARFGIRSIPVLTFFDAKGEEVSRHVGFYPSREILKQLAVLGIEAAREDAGSD